MELNLKERLNFINQFLILEKLDPDNKKYYEKHRIALEHGYTLHYDWIVEHLYDEMSEDECREVLDILQMYRVIITSRQENAQNIPENEVYFLGFDANNESHQLSYARYFTEDLDRFQEVAKSGNGIHDSHIPMLHKYRRMISLWNQFPNKQSLNEDEIRQLLDT